MGAVVGRHDVMQIVGEMFVSSTYWSDAVGLAAALATIRELRQRDAFRQIGAFGARFQQRFDELAEEHELPLRTAGLPQQFAISATEGDAATRRGLKDYYIQEMTRRGFFTSFGVSPSYAHSDADLERASDAWREVFPLMRTALRAGDWDARLTARSVDAFRRQVG
jgi:glutamate-1-semialdehyde 2,1-aminomutase